MPGSELRIVRLPLDVDLIERIDRLVADHRGGFSDRLDLLREAASAFVLELEHPLAPEAGTTARSNGSTQHHAKVAGSDHTKPSDLSFSKLSNPREGSRLDAIHHAVLQDEPLFGLHNRDYPSLWAAVEIAELCSDGPILFSEAQKALVRKAWEFSSRLMTMERVLARHLSALFPSNPEKRSSSERTFIDFAVGQISERQESMQLSGALFQWRILGARAVDSGLEIAISTIGERLLRDLVGLSLELPHERRLAETFLAHLREHAPTDWWGFDTLVRSIGDGISRSELVDRFGVALSRDFAGSRDHPRNWKPLVVATNTAGYVARAREWGLLEPKLFRGTYRLTPFGRDLASTSW